MGRYIGKVNLLHQTLYLFFEFDTCCLKHCICSSNLILGIWVGCQRETMGAKREPNGAQREPKGPKGSQKGAQREPKGAEREPKGAKREPKGAQREPKGTQMNLKGSQREPKVSQIDPKGSQREPKGSQKGYQNAYKNPPTLGRACQSMYWGGGLPPPTPSALGTSPPKYDPNSSIRTLLLKWVLTLAQIQKSCHAEL